MNDTADSQPTSLTAGILSYLVPGLGQIVQGRVLKGLMFLVILLGLFHVGHALGNRQNVYLPDPEPKQSNLGAALFNSIVYQRLPFAGQFWIGIAAWPAVSQYLHVTIPVAVEEQFPFLKTYMKAPEDNEVNPFIRNSDKMPDLGLIYTIIAGVLNILVIYDAYAGPAFVPPKKKPAESPPA